ncbi:MAG: hypothetical protein RMH97_08415 [Verrucomicrobiales bacterium]|nr:hypothetical protein [Verrucomicrobiales bacterium]
MRSRRGFAKPVSPRLKQDNEQLPNTAKLMPDITHICTGLPAWRASPGAHV